MISLIGGVEMIKRIFKLTISIISSFVIVCVAGVHVLKLRGLSVNILGFVFGFPGYIYPMYIMFDCIIFP